MSSSAVDPALALCVFRSVLPGPAVIVSLSNMPIAANCKSPTVPVSDGVLAVVPVPSLQPAVPSAAPTPEYSA